MSPIITGCNPKLIKRVPRKPKEPQKTSEFSGREYLKKKINMEPRNIILLRTSGNVNKAIVYHS